MPDTCVGTSETHRRSLRSTAGRVSSHVADGQDDVASIVAAPEEAARLELAEHEQHGRRVGCAGGEPARRVLACSHALEQLSVLRRKTVPGVAEPLPPPTPAP